MEPGTEAMKVALRILSAVNERRQPDEADLEALRKCAGPEPPGATPDEFASAVIHQELRRRSGPGGHTRRSGAA